MALTRMRPGPHRFEETYEDDILGTLHARPDVTRDIDNKIRRRDDLGELDRDRLLEGWSTRTEELHEPV